MDEKTRLLEILKHRSVSRGEVILSSGRVSDFYIDARLVTLSAEGAFLTAKIMLERLNPNVDSVGGMTLGADPMVGAIAAVSFSMGRPINTFIIRKTPKGHGKKRLIEGNLGRQVAVIDDVTTTGASILQAIRAVEAYGAKVLQVLTLVDRCEGAKETLKEGGYNLEAIFTKQDL